MYTLINDKISNEPNAVYVVNGDRVTIIPFDPDNSDYQKYQEWLAAGNTPLPPA